MVENIKSSFFSIILFSFLDKGRKLKIIKYNKSLQQLLGINLRNYQIISGRYIIYETDKIGKEYLGRTNQLIYEAQYLNGERNGKGKEYCDG